MHRLFSTWFWLPIILGLVPYCSAEDRAEEAGAVRRAAEQYIAALQRGDADTLVAAWTADGDFVDNAGVRTQGRKLVAQVTAKKGSSVAPRDADVTVDSIRFIKPDVAIEDGTVKSPSKNNDSSVSRYTAIWVKREGKWLLDSVRESASSERLANDQLHALTWLIGDWVEQGAAGKVELTCRKSADGNYLLREIKIETPEGATHAVSQRIGWDAAKKQITAWTFDSDGGHAVGVWSPKGDQWVVRSEGVLPDGQTASSLSIYSRDGDDSFTWESKSLAGTGSPVANRKVVFNRINANDNSNSSNR